MRFLVNPSTDPYFNMAFDEYCLTQYSLPGPVFYLWRNRPSVIIGLNQNAFSEVNLEYLENNGILLARRVTGGGAVYHDLQNLNYSIIGRSVSPQPVVDALRMMGVAAELTGRNDIFVDGRKVSGYARRVWQDRELIHGTLMYDVDMDALTQALNVPGSKMDAKGIASIHSRVANLKDYLPGSASVTDFAGRLHALLAGDDAGTEPDHQMLEAVRKLADGKFSRWEWIYGHSREVSFLRRARFACGTVEAGILLEHGRIREIRFSGDFIGNLPADTLADRLTGAEFDRIRLAAILETCVIESVFPGVTAAEFAEFLTSRNN